MACHLSSAKSFLGQNAIAADALVPSIARPSATITLITQDEGVCVSHEEEFQQSVPSQFCSDDTCIKRRGRNLILGFFQIYSVRHRLI